MMKLLELPNEVLLRREHFLYDDFYWYVSPHLWTSFATDGGTSVAQSDTPGAGGWVTLTTGATDNNEVAVATTKKPFLFADVAPCVFEVMIIYTEANTDDANIFAGFSSALGAADMMVDDGAGPKTNFSGAGIFKVDSGANGTKWQFITSNATAQTTTVSQHVAGGATAQRLRIECRAISATVIECVPFLNGAQMLDANNRPIKHTVSASSAAAMNAGVYAKAGSANSETPSLDYLFAGQLRTGMPTTSP